jgi:hypothetical protein
MILRASFPPSALFDGFKRLLLLQLPVHAGSCLVALQIKQPDPQE